MRDFHGRVFEAELYRPEDRKHGKHDGKDCGSLPGGYRHKGYEHAVGSGAGACGGAVGDRGRDFIVSNDTFDGNHVGDLMAALAAGGIVFAKGKR